MKGTWGGSQSSIKPSYFRVWIARFGEETSSCSHSISNATCTTGMFFDCTIGILQQKEMCPEILLCYTLPRKNISLSGNGGSRTLVKLKTSGMRTPPPRKVTCPLKTKVMFQPSIFRVYVSFQGGNPPVTFEHEPTMQ